LFFFFAWHLLRFLIANFLIFSHALKTFDIYCLRWYIVGLTQSFTTELEYDTILEFSVENAVYKVRKKLLIQRYWWFYWLVKRIFTVQTMMNVDVSLPSTHLALRLSFDTEKCAFSFLVTYIVMIGMTSSYSDVDQCMLDSFFLSFLQHKQTFFFLPPLTYIYIHTYTCILWKCIKSETLWNSKIFHTNKNITPEKAVSE